MSIEPLHPSTLLSEPRANSYEVDTQTALINKLAELSKPFDAIADPDAVMASVVVCGKQLIVGSSFAALRCRGRAHWSLLAGADISSHRYGELQVAANQGSSVAARSIRDTAEYEPVRIGVHAVAHGHQLWSLGISHILIAPIGAPHDAFGTFNWYLRDGVDSDMVEAAGRFAHQASVAYLHACECSNLRRAAETRLVIGQAQGILMTKFDLEPDAAFDVLRRLSQHGNTKLTTVAERVVRTRSLPADMTRPGS